MSNINMESIEPQNLYSQALTALANGQLVEARNLFSDLITSVEALPPEEINAVLLSQAYVGLGDVESAENQSDAAFEQYRKACDLFSSLPEELTPEFQRAALYVGQRYAESWLFDEAKEVLAQLLSQAPDNSEAHFQLGKVLIDEIGGVFSRADTNQIVSEHQDQISDAIAHLEKAIDLDQNNGQYYYYLGRAYSFNQAHQPAVEAFEHAADIKSTSEYFYWLAITRKELGLYAEAVQVIDQAIELDSAASEAQRLKVELLFLLERFAEAEQICRQLLEGESQNHRMRLFLGRIYYESGNFQDAIRELNSVVNQGSGEVLQDALFCLGRCYSKLRQFDEARRYLERCGASGETAAILYAIGCVYANQGEFEIAMEKFNAALTLEPDNPDVLVQQGHIFCNMQKYEQAQKAYSQALKLNPEHAAALYGLGKLEQVVSNDIENAQSRVNPLLELAPDHALAHYSLGNIYETRGEWEKAIVEYEAALWGDVPCPSAHRRLGVLYCQNTNKFQEALQHLEWARNIGWCPD